MERKDRKNEELKVSSDWPAGHFRTWSWSRVSRCEVEKSSLEKLQRPLADVGSVVLVGFQVGRCLPSEPLQDRALSLDQTVRGLGGENHDHRFTISPVKLLEFPNDMKCLRFQDCNALGQQDGNFCNMASVLWIFLVSIPKKARACQNKLDFLI